MVKLPAVLRNVTPLSLGLAGGAVLALLMAFALVWTSLNEYRSGTGFRKVLRAYGSGAPDVAADGLPEVIAAKPHRYPYPKLLLALLKLRSQDLAGASALYREVLDERETLLTDREKALCYNGLGTVAVLGAKKPDERTAAFRVGREQFQKAVDAWPKLPESYLNLATLALAEGKPDEASRRLTEATAQGCLPPGMEGVRAMALLRMFLASARGAEDEALAQARSFMAYRPEDLEGLTVLAQALVRRDACLPAPPISWSATECEALLSRIRHEANPPRPRALAEAARGAAWLRMESYRVAREQGVELTPAGWDQARGIIATDLGLAGLWAPQDPGLRALRRVQSARDVQWSGAPAGFQDDLQALLAAKGLAVPVQAVLENDLGVVLSLQGHEAEALPHLEQASILAPASAVAALNRAVVLDRLSRGEEAKAWYAKSLSLNPAQPAAQARLAALAPAPAPTPAPAPEGTP